ncbi:unnamed protein product [Echinostoma caproni]|uniref:Uncharacterized protein n=1 Tax=Echinostoma caproni TaxID=27848 RepID=A0A3P8BIY6_9TREM|nr:unnamed protein product [Echinostoma caproni]
MSKRGAMDLSDVELVRIGSQSSLDARSTPSSLDRFENFNPTSLVTADQPNSQCKEHTTQPKWFCDPAELVAPADTQSLQHCHYDFLDVPDMSASAATSSPVASRRRFDTVSENLLNVDLDVARRAPNVPQNALADNTRGVIFMSAPHRGNQSLFALYRWPLRWTLTPEAIQLERNSAYLLDLHSWFNLWAMRHHVRILTMVEQRVTPVNRFWSVLLVPEDKRGGFRLSQLLSCF